MKGRFVATILVFSGCLAALPAHAIAPCTYYSGHASFEGRLGNDRDIGETSITAPIACTPEMVLFTDLRFKNDNKDNREGNWALGVRQLHDTGVAGGYVYYDRKRSGVTDKYHNQATIGAEWLAEHWEIRANGYIPLSDDVEVQTTAGSSTPFLSQTGISVSAIAPRFIREEQLYGGDIEAGYHLPVSPDIWVYGSAFMFGRDDNPNIGGVRARAKYNITNYFALTGTGQYDDERGRQGWLGARVTVPLNPFGAHAAQGIEARMMDSPVRDIDIVTAASVTQHTPDAIVPVLNADTGTAQRVLYVDNSAAGGGNGSKAQPYNTLAAAQAAMADHDIIYVGAGNGTTSGQNAGIALNRPGVKLIGSGVDFVYDNVDFTTSVAGNLNGKVIAAATSAPLITNTAGSGIAVSANDIEVAGVNVSGSTVNNVRITNADNFSLHDSTLNGATTSGIQGEYNNGGTFHLDLRDNIVNANSGSGVLLNPSANSTLTATIIGNSTTNNLSSGIRAQAVTGSSTMNLTISDNDTHTNNAYGIFATADNASHMSATIENNRANGNKNNNGIYVTSLGSSVSTADVIGNSMTNTIGNGLLYQARDTASITGTIRGNTATGNSGSAIVVQTRVNGVANITVQDNTVTTSGAGIRLETQNAANINASLSGNTATGNTTNGLLLVDNSTGSINADAGGGNLGSTGRNRIYGNIGTDAAIDVDGAQVKAQGNWWGSASGLSGAETTLTGPSTIDASSPLTSDPAN